MFSQAEILSLLSLPLRLTDVQDDVPAELLQRLSVILAGLATAESLQPQSEIIAPFGQAACGLRTVLAALNEVKHLHGAPCTPPRISSPCSVWFTARTSSAREARTL